MTATIITEERNISNALISGLANLTDAPTREQVEEKAKQIATIFGYTGDLRNIITEAMISVDTRMGAGVSLVDVAAKHDDQWVRKRDDITWTYSGAYENFLLKDGWPPRMVQSLSDVTSRILGHLQDPHSEGTSWNRRGLVIGHVQSGKTANYTGLIARAADAGYKFIIVIAGIHNNLRKQTQERIDEAFIGRSSDPEDRRSIGVGLDPGYTRYEKEGVGLTAIAVGGLSLSRGLTIEGLTVSYMYRNTKMYDTLMQMGRWFGYRPGFEDLCRVHLSRDSINWYSHIAEAAEELTQQVKRMRRDGLSPIDFGLYVRSHPDSLLITAANKMRSGQEVTVEQTFSGRLRESYIVSTDPDVNNRNFDLIAEHWRAGFGGRSAEDIGKGLIFRDVPIPVIEDFLTRFECHSTFAGIKSDVVNYLERIAEKRPLADVLLISPGGAPGDDGPFRLRNQVRVVGKDQPDGTAWRLNKDRVASRGDEKLGLDDAQRKDAETLANGEDGTGAVSDTHYRMVRNRPLLMIHSLEPRGEAVKGPVAAFGVSFPYGDYSTTINVVVNKVWLQQMQGYGDDPDEEEDYDA